MDDFDAMLVRIASSLPDLATRKEVATALRCSVRTIAKRLADGKLVAVRPGGGFPLIPRTEVERFLLKSRDR